MYKAFQIRLGNGSFADYLPGGRKLSDRAKVAVEACLDTVSEDGEKLDGTRIRDNWFPQIQADVFISHSHADKELAMALAGWLQKEFNLKPFIDSSVWGCANDLLKRIDRRHCFDEARNVYDYDKRNGSTSHVHMMLATALSAMIDRTECLFFLNTPGALSVSQATAKTKSPWILYELSLVQVLRRRRPKGLLRKIALESLDRSDLEKLAQRGLDVEYGVDLTALPELDAISLEGWRARYEKARDPVSSESVAASISRLLAKPLDSLYEMALEVYSNS